MSDDRDRRDSALLLAGWADELRAMASLGLLYTHDSFDRARYTRLSQIAEGLLAHLTDGNVDEIHGRLSAEVGYVTVKVGVAAAVFDEDCRILLVQRRDNGLWAMPGGWADIGDSPAAMTAREVLEETSLKVSVDRLVGLYDSRKHGFRHVHQIYHLVFMCTALSGTPAQTDETLDVGWFAPNAIPTLSPGHLQPVRDAFRALANPTIPAVFD